MKDLKKIEASLELLHSDFNKQLAALSRDSKEFHTALIELSFKYPDHKELLQFIVFINDKLETNHTIFSDIVTESFNELVRVKKEMVTKIIEDKEVVVVESTKPKKAFLARVLGHANIFKDIKLGLISLAVILLAIAVLVAPGMFLEVLKALAKLLV